MLGIGAGSDIAVDVAAGLRPMAIVVPPEHGRLHPDAIRRISDRVPWCTVLLVAGPFADLADWTRDSEMVALGDSATAATDARFVSAFDQRVAGIAGAVPTGGGT